MLEGMKRLLVAAAALSFVVTLSAAAQMGEMAGMDHGKAAPKKMGEPSTSLTVKTEAGKTLVLSLEDLKALPQQTLTAHNGHSGKDESYSGPLLSDVLAKAGIVLTSETEHPMLHEYMVATGTDKYYAVYSLAEVEPGLHKAQVIVAIRRDGEMLRESGQFELINSGDLKPNRWVHNVASVVVRTVQ